MPRYKLTIAYDGGAFCGWQKQEPPLPEPGDPAPAYLRHSDAMLEVPEGRVGLRTVQAVVERAVREIVREPVEVKGASRTDAGVHARGQVAAFTCGGDEDDSKSPGDLPPGAARDAKPGSGWPLGRGVDRLLRAINGRLPEDVLVVSAEPVRAAFDPIGDCSAKAYSYTVHAGMSRALVERSRVMHVWQALDIDAMRRGAAILVGEHDFAAFAAAGHGRKSTVRTVFSCEVIDLGDSHEGVVTTPPAPGIATIEPARRVQIRVSGSGFLYNMVRIIAGTLVEVGKGKMTPVDVRAALESRDRRRAGPTMPPHALCLEWIMYPREKEQALDHLQEQSRPAESPA
ncbi:MAG: tRNA pseudouridine synthase A [Planctomycetota bacterium]|nr:tRNA pseudouridine synthase A [Planctomycetota bacterium]